MGDPVSLLTTSRPGSSGQPVAQLFFNSMGRAPALVFTLAGFAVMNLVAVTGLQSGSRSVFAIARDDLLPLSRVWRRISPRSRTPVAAVWVYAALEVAVNLLGLVSDTAIGAVFNVCTVALNVSYLLPIVCKIVYGRFEKGPWHLGRWSFAANVVAVVWNVFVSVVFFFPTKVPVTRENVSCPRVFLLGIGMVGVDILTMY
jgi:amino acid transporter